LKTIAMILLAASTFVGAKFANASNPLFPGIEGALDSHKLCVSVHEFHSEKLEVLIQNGIGQINNQAYKYPDRINKSFTDVPLKATSPQVILSSIRVPPEPCELTTYEIKSHVDLQFSIENEVFRDTFACSETAAVREYQFSDSCQN
jgi:hypothetical protein